MHVCVKVTLLWTSHTCLLLHLKPLLDMYVIKKEFKCTCTCATDINLATHVLYSPLRVHSIHSNIPSLHLFHRYSGLHCHFWPHSMCYSYCHRSYCHTELWNSTQSCCFHGHRCMLFWTKKWSLAFVWYWHKCRQHGHQHWNYHNLRLQWRVSLNPAWSIKHVAVG